MTNIERLSASMGIQDLQALLEGEGVSVDLFRIGRNHAGGFRLVLDAEGCLDRLYGGYFSDWACGGQWARCMQFLTTLSQALSEHQVSLCVCFNGAHPTPPAPPTQWLQTQTLYRQRINSVLRHIVTKGTPPPKVWWVPPAGLHSCLRTALRYLNIPIMVSSDDHYQEVVGLCREKGYAGLVGCAGEYLVFQPPRYFSSALLKLTYRSSLETKEYMVHELAKVLDVPQDRLCLAAALLGNSIISQQNLHDFYKRLGHAQKKVQPEALIKSVCAFVRDLPSSDVEAACGEIFGENDLRAAKLKQAVQYYLNGTKDGFLKYKTASARRPKNNNKNSKNQKPDAPSQSQPPADMDTSILATDSSEHEQKGLEDYKMATLNASLNADLSLEGQSLDLTGAMRNMTIVNGEEKKPDFAAKPASADEKGDGVEKPAHAKEGKRANNKQVHLEDNCPPAPSEVLRTCAERHTRGLMSPQMLSILTHRQVTLPVVMEDDNHREIPSIHHFYRPIRQNVYAILYNMHHHRFMAQKAKEEGGTPGPACSVQIAEWIYSRQNPGRTAEMVPGVLLEWPVPTVQRLWFGTAQDDKCRRLRAFLSTMRSDTPLMLNTSYVPQHLLILATVLRYIMTSQVQILRRQELDAFLATAFSGDLMNAIQLQEMTVNGISSRGVQLGALVMSGAEAALLANDACGAPVPWLVASPWLYFDGKLLQRNLQRAQHCKHLAQLCDNHLDTVVKVERMRKAILEGLDVEFALPPLALPMLGMGYGRPGMLGWGGGSTRGGRARGGAAQLEVAGVVVGQWGNGSYGARNNRYASQVSYVGYTPTPRNAYGGRGYRGGSAGARRGARGGRTARGARRQRRDGPASQDEPARGATLTLNGKTVRSEDIAASGEDTSSPQEDNVTPETDTNGLPAQKANMKTAKNTKKNLGKGKKKLLNQKTDSAHGSEANGSVADKNKVTAE